MHRAGAAGITELLRFPVPPAEQRTVPCCGGRTDVRFDISRELADAGAQVVGARHFYSSHCRENLPKRTFSKGTPQQAEIQRGMQFLPVIVGKPVPSLYVQMDGTGVPVVKKETVGRHGKTEGQPAHTGGPSGLRLYASRMGCERRSHPRSGFDHLRRSYRWCGAYTPAFRFSPVQQSTLVDLCPGFLTDFVVGVQTACQLP
jgi:hypothetical protein